MKTKEIAIGVAVLLVAGFLGWCLAGFNHQRSCPAPACPTDCCPADGCRKPGKPVKGCKCAPVHQVGYGEYTQFHGCFCGADCDCKPGAKCTAGCNCRAPARRATGDTAPE